MLSERDLRILAQIEAHLRVEAPDLVRFLARTGRRGRRTGMGPGTARGLAAVALTVLAGLTTLAVGLLTHGTALVACGLITMIIVPLPVWLATSNRRYGAGARRLAA
ncbi:MAG: DUF3040 domain-containing protein [Betaproteobacteria bacterium]